MNTRFLPLSIAATLNLGICLSIATAQEPSPRNPSTPDSGDLVEPVSSRSASGSPRALASAGQDENPSADPRATETPSNLSDLPDTAPGPSSQLERTSMILTKIRDNERAVDPFGLPMDPGGLPSGSVLADQYEEIVEEREVSATSLASALQQLSLTGAYPAAQRVVVGPRAFEKGEEFGMRFGELTLRIRFEGIEKKKVYFRDMDTKELAFVDFSPRPQEFEPIFKNSRLSTPSGISAMNNLFIVN